jgi:hypothetical protein
LTFKNDFALSDVATPIPWSGMEAGAPTWDPNVTYQTGDIVTSTFGSTWISLVDDNIGNDPPFSAEWAQNTIVPITPQSTGIIVIQGVLTLEEIAGLDQEVGGFISVNGAPLPAPALISDHLPANASTTVPFLALRLALPIGVRADVQVAFASSVDGGVTIEQESSSIELREMQVATG